MYRMHAAVVQETRVSRAHSQIELCIEGCTKSVGCRFKYRQGYVKLWALFVFDEIFFIFYSLLYFMRNS